MPDVVRRDDAHRYFIEHDGHEYAALGVTRTLVENNLVDNEFFTDVSRGRGTMVHFFCEHLFLHSLGAIEVPPHVSGYLVGVRKFLDQFAPTVIGTEKLVGCFPRLYAGGLDLDLILFDNPAIVEVKTSSPTPWHGVQLAAYAYAKDGPAWRDVQRFGLYLTESGGFRLKEYDRTIDLQIFFNGLENLHWRIAHGSYERPYGRRAEDRDADGTRIVDDEATGHAGIDPPGDLPADGGVDADVHFDD